jgi:hypothetical protein
MKLREIFPVCHQRFNASRSGLCPEPYIVCRSRNTSRDGGCSRPCSRMSTRMRSNRSDVSVRLIRGALDRPVQLAPRNESSGRSPTAWNQSTGVTSCRRTDTVGPVAQACQTGFPRSWITTREIVTTILPYKGVYRCSRRIQRPVCSTIRKESILSPHQAGDLWPPATAHLYKETHANDHSTLP